MASLRPDIDGTAVPTPLDEFFGRRDDIERVAERLERQDLAWIAGPPGVGKTRLAHEVVRQQTDRYWFVDAHQVTSEAALLHELGRSVGVAQVRSIEELLRTLSDRARAPGWVVLDNVDDVTEPAHEIATRLAKMHMRVICTARLNRPDAVELAGLEPHEAEKLIEARAGRRLNDVRTLTDLLGGLPLAIELAAHQLDIMSATALAGRLSKGYAPATLQAAICESWERLAETERETLVAASTFGFEFDLASIESVCSRPADEAVRTLVRHSLLNRSVDEAGEVRFRVLDAVRSFVRAELDPAEAEVRHATYHADLAYEAWVGQHSTDVARHVDLLVATIRELEVAMEHALRHELAEQTAQLLLGFTLHHYYLDTRHRTFEWVERARELVKASTLSFSVWYELAHAKIDVNLPDEAEPYVHELEELAESALERATAARTRSRQAHHLGDVPRGVRLAEEALDLARESGDQLELITSLRNWAGVSYPMPAHRADALAALHEASRAAARLGALHHEAMCHYLMAYALAESGHVAAERDAIEKALALFERAHNPGLVLECRWLLGMLEGTLGRSSLARRVLQEVHDDALAAGMFSLARTSAEILFSVEIDAGDFDAADAAIALQEELLRLEPDNFGHHWIQVQKGRLLAHRGELAGAETLLELALSTEAAHWNPGLQIWPRGILLVVLGRLGRGARVDALAEELSKLAVEFDNTAWLSFANFARAALEYFRSDDELRFATVCAELGQTDEYAHSAEIRSVVRLAGGLQWARATDPAPLDEVLLISEDCRRFRAPGSDEWVDIAHRKMLVALLSNLVQGSEAGRGPLTPETLIAATWQDETLTRESGRNRLRASISMLRKAGIGKLIVFENGGYQLTSDVSVMRM